MTDDLRTRIAAVIRSALLEVDYSDAQQSADGEQWVFIDGTVIPENLADAVIRELGWRQEWCVEYTPEGQSPATTQLAEWSCSHERITNDHERAQWDATSWARDFPDEQPHVVARYVTEWETEIDQ